MQTEGLTCVHYRLVFITYFHCGRVSSHCHTFRVVTADAGAGAGVTAFPDLRLESRAVLPDFLESTDFSLKSLKLFSATSELRCAILLRFSISVPILFITRELAGPPSLSFQRRGKAFPTPSSLAKSAALTASYRPLRSSTAKSLKIPASTKDRGHVSMIRLNGQLSIGCTRRPRQSLPQECRPARRSGPALLAGSAAQPHTRAVSPPEPPSGRLVGEWCGLCGQRGVRRVLLVRNHWPRRPRPTSRSTRSA